jgi:hypothetical protein
MDAHVTGFERKPEPKEVAEEDGAPDVPGAPDAKDAGQYPGSSAGQDPQDQRARRSRHPYVRRARRDAAPVGGSWGWSSVTRSTSRSPLVAMSTLGQESWLQ